MAITLILKYSDRHIHIMLCGDVVATLLALVATCGDVATICPPLITTIPHQIVWWAKTLNIFKYFSLLLLKRHKNVLILHVSSVHLCTILWYTTKRILYYFVRLSGLDHAVSLALQFLTYAFDFCMRRKFGWLHGIAWRKHADTAGPYAGMFCIILSLKLNIIWAYKNTQLRSDSVIGRNMTSATPAIDNINHIYIKVSPDLARANSVSRRSVAKEYYMEIEVFADLVLTLFFVDYLRSQGLYRDWGVFKPRANNLFFVSCHRAQRFNMGIKVSTKMSKWHEMKI